MMSLKRHIKILTWIIAGFSISLLVSLSYLKSSFLHPSPSSPPWINVLESIIASLLASIIFYLFYQYSEKKDDNFGKEFKKVKLNDAMGGTKYWKGLLGDIDSTGDDIYFYGRNLSPWCNDECNKFFNKKLKKFGEKSRSNKIYFLWHEEDKVFENFFSSIHNRGNVISEKITGTNNYAIVLCGKKMAITLKTPETHGADNPVIEVRYKSAPWNSFKKYLESIVATGSSENTKTKIFTGSL